MKKLIVLILTLTTSLSFTFAGDSYKPGDKARSFTLKNVDGKMVSPADFKDAKGFIVIFTCNHCPFAVKYEDRIIALHKKYAAEGYLVLAINPNDKNREPDDSFEEMVIRAKEKKFPFPYLYDESQEIAKAFGATRTPHIYIVSKKGNELTVEYVGAIDNNSDDPTAVTERYVEDALNALIAHKPITTTSTKAIGCTIKWKPTN